MEKISYEEFKKLDLRVGKIISAERVEGSSKLIKLKVDTGDGEIQIVAGIGGNYGADDLPERDIVVIVNLEPRNILGVESQGMLLAADEGGPVLLMPDRSVPPGTMVK